MQVLQSIQNKIYEFRGQRVLLDVDLAALYEVETKVLNQAVKRNIKRFPEDFMFQLTTKEWQKMRSQFVPTFNSSNPSPSNIVTLNPNLKSQIVTSSWGGSRKLPYAFTEQGVAMLSGILNSDRAININIAIMGAFVDIRKISFLQNDLKEQLQMIKDRLGEHDSQLNQMYDAMKN